MKVLCWLQNGCICKQHVLHVSPWNDLELEAADRVWDPLPLISRKDSRTSRGRPAVWPTAFCLTCDSADLLLGQVSGDAGHMGPQTVAQQMDLVPGQLQLILDRRAKRTQWIKLSLKKAINLLSLHPQIRCFEVAACTRHDASPWIVSIQAYIGSSIFSWRIN